MTFSQKSQAPDLASQGSGDPKAPTLGQMKFSDLAQNLSALAPQKQVQLQLNWSEYFQGKWSDRKSSDLNRAASIDVLGDCNPLLYSIHVVKEIDDNGNEEAVKVILDCPQGAFRLVGKNNEPTFSDNYWELVAFTYYSYANAGVDATKMTGSGPFQVSFTEEIVTQNGQVTETTAGPEPILQQGNDFAILLCDTVMPMSLQSDLAAEAKMLAMPFFYQDSENDITLFVQPSLTETTINEWIWWAIPVSIPDPNLANDGWWKTNSLVSQVPQIGPVNPGDPSSIYQIQPRGDWVTNPATAISFGGSLIGQSGALSIQKVTGAVTGSIGSFTTGATGILRNVQMANTLTTPSGAKLNMVGPSGLNLAGLQASKIGLNTVFSKSTDAPILNRGGIS